VSERLVESIRLEQARILNVIEDLLADNRRLNWMLSATAEQLSGLPHWDREAIDEAMKREAEA